MPFRRCRQEDPFTARIRKVYGCNALRAPRSGIQPTDVLAVRKRHVERRGGLLPILERENAIELPPITSGPVSGMQGTRSAEVNAGFGVDLTATLLHSLGVPAPGASATANLWNGASAMAFEVRDVLQHEVDVGELGKALTGAAGVERLTCGGDILQRTKGADAGDDADADEQAILRPQFDSRRSSA